jgi:hypothetical protein
MDILSAIRKVALALRPDHPLRIWQQRSFKMQWDFHDLHVLCHDHCYRYDDTVSWRYPLNFALKMNIWRCRGKWHSEALSTSGQADGFGSHAASATWGSFCSAGLTETLMLLELCKFCCAGAAHLSGAGLRCRRHGQLCLGAEGLEEPEAPRVENTSDRGWRRPGRDVPKGMTRPGRDLGLFRCRRCGAVRCDTWLLRTCKGDTVRGRVKGRRV